MFNPLRKPWRISGRMLILTCGSPSYNISLKASMCPRTKRCSMFEQNVCTFVCRFTLTPLLNVLQPVSITSYSGSWQRLCSAIGSVGTSIRQFGSTFVQSFANCELTSIDLGVEMFQHWVNFLKQSPRRRNGGNVKKLGSGKYWVSTSRAVIYASLTLGLFCKHKALLIAYNEDKWIDFFQKIYERSVMATPYERSTLSTCFC